MARHGTNELRFRATDKHVLEETGVRPLSVSSDRIAVVAWRCARLLTALGAERGHIDRVDGAGVFEVYPAAALSRSSITGKGYKARGPRALREGQRQARGSLLDQLQGHAPWLDLSAALQMCVDSDDALDAVIASLVARAAAQRLTDRPDVNKLDRARREGWIHLPLRESLGRLADAR